MDGILRRVSAATWKGTLHGYEVHVFQCLGVWSFAAINLRGGYTETRQDAASFRDAARRARECVEWRVVSGGPSST